MKVSTENDNNFGYEKITILVDNIPLIVANIRCFILIAVEIFHNIIRIESFTCLPRNFHMTWQWTHSGKHVRNCLLMKKAHGTNRIVEERKHWWILYENYTKRRIQQALCKNKKTCYTDLHFSTCKHNLVSFFGRIIFWQ